MFYVCKEVKARENLKYSKAALLFNKKKNFQKRINKEEVDGACKISSYNAKLHY